MIRYQRKRNGFTLMELMMVVCVIILCLCLARIAFWPMMMKARQARTMADMQTIADAMNACLADRDISPLGPPRLGLTLPGFEYPTVATATEIELFLNPDPSSPRAHRCLQMVKEYDGWGNPFYFFWYPDFLTDPGVPITVLAIVSYGSDGIADGASYDKGLFPSNEYHHDVIVTDGAWYRSPR